MVGGGITGAGVALDAASRGLRTALVERDDFASGTSSKSKLVHGGLRYLQQGDVRLVYEALAERQRLRHNAPHLVKLLPFLIPIFSKDGVINPKLAGALGSAMWMYDLTGGARIGKLHKRLKKARRSPTCRRCRRSGSARTSTTTPGRRRPADADVARTAAVDHGAVVANGAPVVALPTTTGGRAARSRPTAAHRGRRPSRRERRRRVVRRRACPRRGHDPDSIRPAKGIHITVPWEKVRNDIAVVVPVPKDKRCVFVVPWSARDGGLELTYIGTTDTDYDGPIDDPQCTAEDIAYLLGPSTCPCGSRSPRPTSSAPGPGSARW